MTALNKQELRELRAAFQSWWKTQRSVCQFSRIQSYEGPYRSKAVQSAWEVWQAAHGSKLEAAEKRIAELEANKGKPVMFIDGDISASDAEKLAAVIREWDDAPATVAPEEMEARTVTLPDVEKWRSVDAVRAQNAYKVLVSKVLAAAGIGVKGE
ncbi:hypothetical protein [uncultured Citrobacter sp.]|uniref:hypothetical protein n=1 Tax=uncultured Citrobacter sp. TaxID=200446 RepID=UPI00266CBB8B|nr:hypothetical protein [uncultured Citrobacter sp.]